MNRLAGAGVFEGQAISENRISYPTRRPDRSVSLQGWEMWTPGKYWVMNSSRRYVVLLNWDK